MKPPFPPENCIKINMYSKYKVFRYVMFLLFNSLSQFPLNWVQV